MPDELECADKRLGSVGERLTEMGMTGAFPAKGSSARVSTDCLGLPRESKGVCGPTESAGERVRDEYLTGSGTVEGE